MSTDRKTFHRMTGYTKLFSSILMSSIWEESNETRLVWVTMLALADQFGHVDGTVKSLARVARVSVEDCQKALDCFLSPDPYDRSGVDDGRRIVAENGGWTLVNHAAYRQKMSIDERRQRDRERKRAKRCNASATDGNDVRVSAPRPQTSEFVRDVSHTEAEADQKQIRTDQKQEKKSGGSGALMMSALDYEKSLRFNAYVGARLQVPHKLHRDFSALLGGDNPDAVLRAWYADIDAELERTKEPIAPTVWKFLEARFKVFMEGKVTADMWAAYDAKHGISGGTDGRA